MLNNKNKNNSIADLEIGFFQEIIKLFFISPANKKNTNVRKINIFISAVLIGIKTIKATAQKKADLLKYSLN
ncbi:MAG: hypothetical protein ACJ0HV_01915 [Candidatus Pseudothioglobus sp.]